jgi:hypothetical protein
VKPPHTADLVDQNGNTVLTVRVIDKDRAIIDNTRLASAS